MKVAHWTMFNNSGMNRVAEQLSASEKALGIDSHVCNVQEKDLSHFDNMVDCDVHVSHTHFPDAFKKKLTKPYKLVWVGHGTPDHVFQTSVESGSTGGYGHGDGFMLAMHWLRNADARVTFWPRHQAIWKSLCDRETPVHLVPLGVDKSFWKPGSSRGKYQGDPSVFTAENCHYIKWPYDLFLAWPWVYPRLPGNACLHAAYLPNNMHRWFFPLVNRNDCSYASHITGMTFNNVEMLNTLHSVDYYIGLVRYGDFNRMSLEANASGTKTISYRGNPYSDFWITEGDQRVIADEMVSILTGKTPPRKKDVVPDASETAAAMIEIYKRISSNQTFNIPFSFVCL